MYTYANACIDSCKQMTYTGCHGNDNRFESEASCKDRCVKHTCKPSQYTHARCYIIASIL